VQPETPEELPGVLLAELAEFPDRAIVDEARLAYYLRITPRTIRRMVVRLELPPPIDFAGRKVWFVGRILNHLEVFMERAERKANPAELESL